MQADLDGTMYGGSRGDLDLDLRGVAVEAVRGQVWRADLYKLACGEPVTVGWRAGGGGIDGILSEYVTG